MIDISDLVEHLAQYAEQRYSGGKTSSHRRRIRKVYKRKNRLKGSMTVEEAEEIARRKREVLK